MSTKKILSYSGFGRVRGGRGGDGYKITGIDGLGKGRALLRMIAEKSGLRKLSSTLVG